VNIDIKVTKVSNMSIEDIDTIFTNPLSNLSMEYMSALNMQLMSFKNYFPKRRPDLKLIHISNLDGTCPTISSAIDVVTNACFN